MLSATPLAGQLASAHHDDPRVLIVGAGVAGLTLAGSLRRQGLHPVLLERARPGRDQGYMLALMPLVDPPIAELGLRPAYLDASVALDRYRVRDRRGRPLREYSLGGLLGRFGDYRGISRGALLDLLGAAGPGTVTYQATATALRPTSAGVEATLRDPTGTASATFDLVVAADGLHSATRGLVPDAPAVSTFDTGWGGWVAWAPPDDDTDLGEELWGAGFFVGTYPVEDRVGVFVGGPRAHTRAGAAAFTARIHRRLADAGGRVDAALRAVSDGGDTYFWPLTDCRCAAWTAGRVVVLGDAAAGFLPTAGVGAAMAMESAHVLAAHLRGVARDDVAAALARYEAAQRPRVEAAQANSRTLARLLFRRGAAAAALRDTATRLISLDRALRPITELLRTSPALPAARRG